MKPRAIRLGVLALGAVPELALKVVTAHFSAYLNLLVEILPGLEEPHHAWDPRRRQYDAGKIIAALHAEPCGDHDKLVGIVNVDLFVPIFTHVFGEAKVGGRCAVVSLHRLRGSPDGSLVPFSVVLERAAKVALHEAGHLFGLLHCMDERCLMRFTGDLPVLDRTPFNLCRYCTVFLRDAIGPTD